MGAPTNQPLKPRTPREKPIPLQPNSHTSRFLYLILKQVDLKHINWQDVADGTGISKGSAAKLKYGRFKRQIESVFLGEAIQVKRERERDVKGEGEQGADADGDGERERHGLKRGGEGDGDVRKRIKLEKMPRIKREDQRLPSIVSVDDDDDEDGDESVNSNTPVMTSSPSRSPFVKPEPAEPGTTHGNLMNHYQPRAPVIKPEPGTGTRTGSFSFNLPIRRERINSTITQQSVLTTPQPQFFNPFVRQTGITLTSPDLPLRLASTAVLNREEQNRLRETGKGNGRGSERDPVDID